MLTYCLAIAVMVTNTWCATTGCKPCGLKGVQNKLEKIMDSKQGDLRRASGDKDDAAPVETKKSKKCCPYEFDSSLCQVVNDRVLCGFNKNVGRPQSDAAAIGLSGGCRLRGGRLECGYEQGPYIGIRRPPAWNSGGYNGDVAPYDEVLEEYEDEDVSGSLDNKQKLSMTKKKSTKRVSMKYTYTAVTKCVEVKDRIVCKTM